MASFMDEAARLARDGVRSGEGGPFGAVVVKEGAVVGAACNRVLSSNDPTAHAEVEAIRAASRALGTYNLAGCELYTTCEPCPMCLAAIHWARIDQVWFAMTRHDAAALGFDDAVIYAAMSVPRVPMTRVENAGAEEAFRLWSEDPGREHY